MESDDWGYIVTGIRICFWHLVVLNNNNNNNGYFQMPILKSCKRFHHHHHQSLNREGCLGATDDFATSFLHFSLFFTSFWDVQNSRPVHSLMLSSHLFLCLPCLLPPFTVPCKMVLARPDEQETWPYHCSLHLFTVVRTSSVSYTHLTLPTRRTV